MTENILYISLTVSIIGLLILTYASTVLEPPLSKTGDIDTNSLGKNIHIRGEIARIHKFKGGSIILTVQDSSGEIDVYLTYNIAMSRADILTEGNRIDVIGEVEIYKGRVEIVPKNPDCIKLM